MYFLFCTAHACPFWFECVISPYICLFFNYPLPFVTSSRLVSRCIENCAPLSISFCSVGLCRASSLLAKRIWCVSSTAVMILPCLSFFTIIFTKRNPAAPWMTICPDANVNNFVFTAQTVTAHFYLSEIVKKRNVKRSRVVVLVLVVVCHVLCYYVKHCLIAFFGFCDSVEDCSLGLLVQRPARKNHAFKHITVTSWQISSSLVPAMCSLLCLSKWIKRCIQKSITFKASVYPWHPGHLKLGFPSKRP